MLTLAFFSEPERTPEQKHRWRRACWISKTTIFPPDDVYLLLEDGLSEEEIRARLNLRAMGLG